MYLDSHKYARFVNIKAPRRQQKQAAWGAGRAAAGKDAVLAVKEDW